VGAALLVTSVVPKRLRMELRTALTWREDVEVALERLLGSMTPERVLLRPSPAAVSSRA
jgi:hypothetical protein